MCLGSQEDVVLCWRWLWLTLQWLVTAECVCLRGINNPVGDSGHVRITLYKHTRTFWAAPRLGRQRWLPKQLTKGNFQAIVLVPERQWYQIVHKKLNLSIFTDTLPHILCNIELSVFIVKRCHAFFHMGYELCHWTQMFLWGGNERAGLKHSGGFREREWGKENGRKRKRKENYHTVQKYCNDFIAFLKTGSSWMRNVPLAQWFEKVRDVGSLRVLLCVQIDWATFLSWPSSSGKEWSSNHSRLPNTNNILLL